MLVDWNSVDPGYIILSLALKSQTHTATVFKLDIHSSNAPGNPFKGFLFLSSKWQVRNKWAWASADATNYKMWGFLDPRGRGGWELLSHCNLPLISATLLAIRGCESLAISSPTLTFLFWHAFAVPHAFPVFSSRCDQGNCKRKEDARTWRWETKHLQPSGRDYQSPISLVTAGIISTRPWLRTPVRHWWMKCEQN